MQRNWIKRLGLVVLGVPAVAVAGQEFYRHVLPCILDIDPQNGELAVDFSGAGTLLFKGTDGLHDLKTINSPAAVRFPDIVETAASVVLKVAGFAAQLQDGQVYTLPADVTVARIQYSYGLGGVPILNAGWVDAFIVPASSSTGDAALAYTQDGSAPSGSQRYLGTFYLAANAACSGDECTTTPTLPTACQDYSDPTQCPANFGRLVGVQLAKHNQHYEYKIQPVLTSTPRTDFYGVTGLPLHARRMRFSSAVQVRFELSNDLYVGPGSVWLSLAGNPTLQAEVSSGAISGFWMVGHEEDASLYEY